MRYDLVVVGGGPAGEKAAAAAAFFQKKVALVEIEAVGPGGAAVHTGTLPSKTLRETALYITGFERRELYRGLGTVGGSASVADLMCRLPEIRLRQVDQIAANLDRHDVELVTGSGRFVGPHTFEVAGRALEADHFLIATGSVPRQPPGIDFQDPSVFDSDTLLHIDQMPKTLAVIGGGVIGSEYACVFSALGVRVEIIEGRPRLLSFLDAEVSDGLMAAMRARGIGLRLGTSVQGLRRDGQHLEIELSDGAKIRADTVLVSAGRTGNSQSLGLAEIGVTVDDRGLIPVNERFQSNVEHICAAGDVIGRPALASSAMEQGRVAVAQMFGIDVPERDWTTIPSGIYTIPEACACGPTEAELNASGVEYVVGRALLKHNARGQIIGDAEGFVKLIFCAQTRKLLATHLICEHATELIHLGQSVMRLGGGIDYFLETVFTYPSLCTAYKYAAYDALGQLDRGSQRPPPLR